MQPNNDSPYAIVDRARQLAEELGDQAALARLEELQQQPARAPVNNQDETYQELEALVRRLEAKKSGQTDE